MVSWDETKKRNRERMQRNRAAGLPENDERHGTYAGYNGFGCRCVPCTHAAQARYRKLKREGRR